MSVKADQRSEQAIEQRPVREIDTVRYALEKMRPQFEMALPRHLTPDRLLRIAMTAIQQNPKLLECNRSTLFAAIMTCAQLGLEPDGILGQAYLVPFKGSVQFIPGYKGLISLARNSGDVVSIAAHEVREHDRFEFDFASGEAPRHTFDLRQERGEIIAAYAIARFRDGGFHFDVMSRNEVDRIRDQSPGYRSAIETARKYKREPTGPWIEHYVEMAKKSAVRRIAKYLPMSVQKAAAIVDAVDAGRTARIDRNGDVVIDGEATEAVPTDRQIGTPSKLDGFEESLTPHDLETGEIPPGPDDRSPFWSLASRTIAGAPLDVLQTIEPLIDEAMTPAEVNELWAANTTALMEAYALDAKAFGHVERRKKARLAMLAADAAEGR